MMHTCVQVASTLLLHAVPVLGVQAHQCTRCCSYCVAVSVTMTNELWLNAAVIFCCHGHMCRGCTHIISSVFKSSCGPQPCIERHLTLILWQQLSQGHVCGEQAVQSGQQPQKACPSLHLWQSCKLTVFPREDRARSLPVARILPCYTLMSAVATD